MNENKTVLVVMSCFAVAVIVTFYVAFELGQLSLQDLKEKYDILTLEDESTQNLLTLADTQIMNLNLYEYYSNGTQNNQPIDTEKIPIISKYPQGNGALCY